MKSRCKKIEVFCDYLADGLWCDGAAIDIEELSEKFNLPSKETKYLKSLIDKWQAMYEEFDFWNSEESYPDRYAKIHSSDEFREFSRLGTIITNMIRDVLPKEIPVIYFDELTCKRFLVSDKHEYILMENQ